MSNYTYINEAERERTEKFEGTYEIEDDKITITYEEDGKTVTTTSSFEKGKDYIKVDGIQLDKAKK